MDSGHGVGIHRRRHWKYSFTILHHGALMYITGGVPSSCSADYAYRASLQASFSIPEMRYKHRMMVKENRQVYI